MNSPVICFFIWTLSCLLNFQLKWKKKELVKRINWPLDDSLFISIILLPAYKWMLFKVEKNYFRHFLVNTIYWRIFDQKIWLTYVEKFCCIVDKSDFSLVSQLFLCYCLSQVSLFQVRVLWEDLKYKISLLSTYRRTLFLSFSWRIKCRKILKVPCQGLQKLDFGVCIFLSNAIQNKTREVLKIRFSFRSTFRDSKKISHTLQNERAQSQSIFDL